MSATCEDSQLVWDLGNTNTITNTKMCKYRYVRQKMLNNQVCKLFALTSGKKYLEQVKDSLGGKKY